MNSRANETIQAIPLSKSTVARRIDEMVRDIEQGLVNSLQAKKLSL